MANANFRGKCMGVKLKPRGAKDPHIMVTLEIEDDEVWFPKDFVVSSYWLDELIEQLQAAQAFCASQDLDLYNGRQFGWKFKKG